MWSHITAAAIAFVGFCINRRRRRTEGEMDMSRRWAAEYK